ncbi:hypothetical protein P280DRAFT_484629 [Massarina eburnea CBS 473.64]|uniref:Heterokaryon incompatibility domain-containing protein n=1 Tax=Massarina eburnea CBS 473.64 TaxID=1395130 RepID=A0A6A6RJX8_9PLEO|nr:hypothetical protein P280DRAFT_484629 [Massarina eburnea CBS 473.64]
MCLRQHAMQSTLQQNLTDYVPTILDALCIIQGKDGEAEWNQEAAHMADVYQNATVTIYAACCSNPQQSFLHRNRRDKFRVLELDDSERAIVMGQFHSPRGFHRYSRTGRHLDPLEERAWAFQEYQMSRRLVAYTSNEIQWRCRQTNTWEHMQMLPHLTRRLCAQNTEDILETWHSLVMQYNVTHLTHAEDKLVAFSGLTSMYESRLGWKCVVGLWEENLVHDLTWYNPGADLHNAPQNGIPTFSWASIHGPILFVENYPMEPKVYRFSYTGFSPSRVRLSIEGQLIPSRVAPYKPNEGPSRIYPYGYCNFQLKNLLFKEDSYYHWIDFYPDTKLKNGRIDLETGNSILTIEREDKRDNIGEAEKGDVCLFRIGMARALSAMLVLVPSKKEKKTATKELD